VVLDKKAFRTFVKEKKLSGVDDFNQIMGELTREVVEIFLENELTDFLGYEKYDHKGKHESQTQVVESEVDTESSELEKNQEKSNSRNGFGSKTVESKFGPLRLSVPRDRQSLFEPQIVKKGATDIIGLEEKVLSLYARGMSTRDISTHVKDLYSIEVSAERVSQITDHIIEKARQWQSRPLESLYSIVYLDGLWVKMKVEGQVKNVTVYNVLGITMEGQKDCLGLWIGDQNDGESSRYWLTVLTELQNRGVKDVLIFSVDNLTGFSEAISSAFPRAEIQKCIVHQIRNSTKHVTRKDRLELSTDLKVIYRASTADQGLLGLDEIEKKWGKKYPFIVPSWRRNWDELSTFFKYPEEIRRLIYTTNPIESTNRGFRKALKTKGAMPNQESVLKLLYLSVEKMSKNWTRKLPRWGEIYHHLAIYFEDRMTNYLYERQQ